MRLLPIILIIASLSSGPAPAAEESPGRSARREIWRRNLAGEEALIARVESLAGALGAGEVDALGQSMPPGALRLQIRTLGMPLTVCGRSQARVLLSGYFSAHAAGGLKVAQARLEPRGGRVRVAFEHLAAAGSGPRLRRRFIAELRRERDDWLLSELRCP